MSQTERPNILFLFSDQHNARCLGHEGHPDVKTPHLDRLAEQGMRFSRAVTNNPICTPSRVSFLSGQYCHNHGYYGLSGPNPRGLPSIFHHFRRFGYRTAAIGKTHLPEYWIEDHCDLFCDTNHHSSIGGRNREYARFLREQDATDKEDHKGFPEFGGRGTQTCDGRPSNATHEQSQEGYIAARTVAFMTESRDMGKPFIVHATMPRPHQTYAPSKSFWDMYDPNTFTLPPNADLDVRAARKAPNLIRTAEHWRKGNWTLFEPRTFEAGRLRKLRGYYGNISEVDHAVGTMLDALDELGLAENTIVVYSSDHGDYAAQFGLMEKAPGICSDAITRIPMIWRVPGTTAANTRCDELVEAVDVSQTLCALAGIDPMQTADGKDISALLRGEGGPVRDVAVTEFAWAKSVRKGDWRLVWYPRERFPEQYPDGFGELYNLADDPWEMKNLWFEPEHQAKVRELGDDLMNWLVTTTRPTTALGAGTGGWGEDDPGDPQTIERYNCRVNLDRKLHPDRLRRSIGSDGNNYL